MREFLGCTRGVHVCVALAVVLFGGDATTPWHPGLGLLVSMEGERREFVSFPSWIDMHNSEECRCEVPWNMSNGLAGATMLAAVRGLATPARATLRTARMP